jgi:hypothetical protein
VVVLNAYRLPSFEPTNTRLPHFTGDDVGKTKFFRFPVCAVHASFSPLTLPGPNTFSNALNRRPDALNPRCSQLVDTTKNVCAESPLWRPLTVTQCAPGVAPAGTDNPAGSENAPLAFVDASTTSVVSKYTSSVSLAPNPEPLIGMAVVGGPNTGLIVIAGAANADDANARLTTATTNPATRFTTHAPPGTRGARLT